MYSILVLEDDNIQLKTLSGIIKESSDTYKVYEAENTIDAFKVARKVKIDLFYIDVNLKNESGLEFAREIRKIENYKLTWIVFVTIYREYMLTAFKKIHCYDYILKPYNKENIQILTKLLLSDSKAQIAVTEVKNKFIVVNIKNIQVKIYVNEIIFVEVFIRTSIIHTINGSFTIDYLSLKKLHTMINYSYILQSHRSYLINIKHVNKIEKTNDRTACKIYFNNCEETALLGNNFKKFILQKFNNAAGGDINERV